MVGINSGNTPPKVICKLVGGLGNQLFTYAAAKRLAIENSAELVVDNVSGFKYDHLYKRTYQLDKFRISARLANPSERMEPFSRIRRYIKKKKNSRYSFSDRDYLFQEKIDYDQRLLNFKVIRDTYFEGYWQSENYFRDHEAEIRHEFEIIEPSDNINLKMAESIKCAETPVALHFRFFDTNNDRGNNLDVSYYLDAIHYCENKLHKPHYYIFSDKPDSAIRLLGLKDLQITLVTHNNNDEKAYIDLWLMQLCSHYIIANSSFSWWGAWLGQNENKMVVAPNLVKKSGVSWWGFKGLIPENWITI